MKKLILAVAVLLFTGVAFGQEKTEIDKEKEAIMKVIKEEVDAFDAKDFDRLANTFVQDETLSRLSANKSNYHYFVGWEDIGPRYKDYFEQSSEPRTTKRTRTNVRVKVYTESAWATFNEKNELNGGEELKLVILEKVESEWKIVCLTIINTSSYEEETEETDK